MLPGLPPIDRSFKGWLRPLIVPVAAAVLITSLVGVAASLFGEETVTYEGVSYTGFEAVWRIVLAAPVCFLFLLLLITTICWAESRWMRKRR